MAISADPMNFDNPAVETTSNTPASAAAKRAPRFLLLIPDDLRAALERSAAASSRSLSAEINLRLRASIKADPEDVPVLVPGPVPGQHYVPERPPPAELSASEKQMLAVFNTLPADKQLALLTLLKR